jgi:hypothetical protein
MLYRWHVTYSAIYVSTFTIFLIKYHAIIKVPSAVLSIMSFTLWCREVEVRVVGVGFEATLRCSQGRLESSHCLQVESQYNLHRIDDTKRSWQFRNYNPPYPLLFVSLSVILLRMMTCNCLSRLPTGHVAPRSQRSAIYARCRWLTCSWLF